MSKMKSEDLGNCVWVSPLNGTGDAHPDCVKQSETVVNPIVYPQPNWYITTTANTEYYHINSIPKYEIGEEVNVKDLYAGAVIKDVTYSLKEKKWLYYIHILEELCCDEDELEKIDE